jgi:hypothetical protein
MPHATNTPTLIKGFTAAGAIAAKRFVTRTITQAGAGVSTLGVSDYEAAIKENISVIVLGTALVEAGAAIDGTAWAVESDAQGRAIPKNTGKTAGLLMPGSTATAAGQFVEILVVQTP